ncbi:TPA: glycosyltransferase family 4 protein [Legionella pneumophila]
MGIEIYIFSTRSQGFGGGENYLIHLAALLSPEIHVSVVSPPLIPLKNGLINTGAQYIEIPAYGRIGKYKIFLKWMWRQRINLRSKNIIFIMNGRGAAYLSPFVNLIFGISPVTVSHTALSLKKIDVKEIIYGIALRYSQLVVAVSQSVASQHKQRWPSLNVQAIPNWLPRVERNLNSRQMESSVLKVAVVARLDAGKGHHELIQALEDDVDIEVHFYGDGSLRAELQKLTKPFKKFYFHGYVDDLLSKLDSNNLYICNSHSESFNYSLLESINAGLLCIVSDIPAHREMLGDNYPEELFFPAGNMLAIKKSVAAARNLLVRQQDKIAAQLICETRNRIIECYHPESALKQYKALFSEIGNGKYQ